MKRLLFAELLLIVAIAACQKPQSKATKQEATAVAPVAEQVQKYSAADLLVAFKESFGQAAPVDIVDANGEMKVYNPTSLIDITPELVALIVKGEIPEGCHACSGSVSIFYLKHMGSSFELLGKWPDLTGEAEFGRAADWTIRKDLTQYPALYFTASGGGQGCSYTSHDLVELTPSRPIVRATNLTTEVEYTPDGEGDATPATHLNGVISTYGPNHTLRIAYTGTEHFTLEFFQDGETFEPDPSKHPAPGC